MSPSMTKIWTTTKAIVLGSWRLFATVVVVVVGFFGYFTDFKRPDLIVEVTTVTTRSTDPIDLIRLPELGAIKDFFGTFGIVNMRPSPLTKSEPGMVADEVDREMGIAMAQLAAQTNTLDRQSHTLDAILSTPKPDELSQLEDLLRDISGPFFDPYQDSTLPKTAPDADRIDLLQKKIRKALDDRRKTVASNAAKSEAAAKAWQAYKKDVLPNKERLIVTCAIGNRGSGATSLKPQGLLRANLGDGNYLDVLMKLSGYEESAELAVLPSESFKVVKFQSEEVQSMNPADRQRYATFLGNVSPATIFVTDVRGTTYASNSVPFSPGVYEQKVYDLLKQYATRYVGR